MSNEKSFTFKLTGEAAENLSLEAAHAGLEPLEFTRRAIGLKVVFDSLKRQIESCFDFGADLTYSIGVVAVNNANPLDEKEFMLSYEPDNPASISMILLDPDETDTPE